jgi:hypothetical protein
MWWNWNAGCGLLLLAWGTCRVIAWIVMGHWYLLQQGDGFEISYFEAFLHWGSLDELHFMDCKCFYVRSLLHILFVLVFSVTLARSLTSERKVLVRCWHRVFNVLPRFWPSNGVCGEVVWTEMNPTVRCWGRRVLYWVRWVEDSH